MRTFVSRAGRRPLATIVSATSLALAATVLAACGGSDTGSEKAEGLGADGCITDYAEGTDYFPDKLEVTEAEGFTISYHDSYQVLTVDQPYEGGKPETYVLVKCGAPEPELSGDLAGATSVEVPVKSIYSASTTHLPSITEIGATKTLTGVSAGSFVSTPEVIDAIKVGTVAEYAANGTIDVEKVVAGNPDVLVTAGVDDPAYAKIREAGTAVVADSEWLEADPLGRAEWVKVFAALTGKEAEASKLYAEIEKSYAEVAAKVADAEPVEVLPGGLYQGTWSMPAGGSYVGRLVKDAGGTYPWDDDQSTGSKTLDFESVYAKAADIKVWLVNDSTATSVKTLVAQDSHYPQLAAAGGGQVYNATKKVNATGGNDYWESGALRPDQILGDLAQILHPELFEGRELVYYVQLK